MSSVNLWFEHIIDAYLRACAEGGDWHAACAAAEQAIGNGPLRVLTREDLKTKGLKYSRQHLKRRINAGTFPPAFRLPEGP
jgi:hypothetical protein